MVIDVHVHVWDRLDGMIANETPVIPLGQGMIRMGDKELLGMPPYMLDCKARVEYLMSEFDAAGVDAGVVVQDYMDGEQNDYLLANVANHQGRLFAHALPDFWRPGQVAQQAEKLFAKGFRGLKLPAEHLSNKLRLDDDKLLPLWKHMEKSSFVLAVDLCEGESQVPQMENVLKTCPLLRVAIGHFGYVNRGGWPGQLDLCRYPNVYIETGGMIWLYRNEGFPFPGAVESMERAIALVGVEKIMWGSDWPRTMIDFTYRQSIDFIRRSSRFSADQKAAILGGNAMRLYGFKEPAAGRQPVAVVTEG